MTKAELEKVLTLTQQQRDEAWSILRKVWPLIEEYADIREFVGETHGQRYPVSPDQRAPSCTPPPRWDLFAYALGYGLSRLTERAADVIACEWIAVAPGWV